MTSSETIDLLIDLVRRDSVTPDDKGCQQLIANRLEPLGFHLEFMSSGAVTNLWARLGSESPLFVFAGHTDVVPTGEHATWTSPPFEARIVNDHVIGRGAADMKGGLAAMVVAIERFVRSGVARHGSIALLLTSDEEGPANEGTAWVVQQLQQRGENIDFCIVGEPSSTTRLGDTLRHGRRGSLGASLRIQGRQGHVAYPHLADNPIHRALPALAELTAVTWDKGNEHFPATTLQISNINAGTGATNVIPGQLSVEFNVRYSPETSIEKIEKTIDELFSRHQLNSELTWKDSARPFITTPGLLTDVVQKAIFRECGITATLDTGGGTSDGRFIAPTGAQVVELGPVNASIHQVDECVSCTDVETLTRIYESVLHQILGLHQE
jgi:succinyl-diaminopimelate desuccinylase